MSYLSLAPGARLSEHLVALPPKSDSPLAPNGTSSARC